MSSDKQESKDKKQNPWIAHVKKVAAEKGVGYREALRMAETKASYKKD